jgi:phosphate transport system protein
VGDDRLLAFYPDLTAIDDRIRRLFGLVQSALAQATHALLTGNRREAEQVMAADSHVDALAQQTDRLVQHEMELVRPTCNVNEHQSQSSSTTAGAGSPDVRYLLTALRIVPQLERSADLVEHIAALAATGLVSGGVGTDVQDLVADMAATTSAMWEESARAWVERDPTASERLEHRDDELDVVAESLTGSLNSQDVAVLTGMDLALLVRFYERLGDHAVHLTRRIRYLVEGD